MTDYYVDSTVGLDTNAGTSWGSGNAWATLFQATVKPILVGDRVFVKNNTAGDSWTATKTYTFPGTAASPNQIYSVAAATTNTPPVESDLSAGATVTIGTTGEIDFLGEIYVWGFTFKIGNTTTSQVFKLQQGQQTFDNCIFDFSGSTGGGGFVINAGGTIFLNPTIKFGATSQSVGCNAPLRIKGGILTTTLAMTSVFSLGINSTPTFVEGFDISALPSTGTVLLFSSNVNNPFYGKDLKIASPAPTLSNTPSIPSNSSNRGSIFTRTDSTGTVNQFAAFSYEGTETRETSITRVGGGADFNSALFSKKIVTTANCKIVAPYEALNQSTVNTVTGAAKTVTVFGTINAGSVPNNNDIWLEVEYPKDSGDPLGGYKSSEGGSLTTIGPGLSPLASASAVSSDSSSWNGGGSGAGWSPFKLSVSITPQLAGPLTVRVYAAKASTTYYIDPAPTVV